jgi:rhamnose transport system permease protein
MSRSSPSSLRRLASNRDALLGLLTLLLLGAVTLRFPQFASAEGLKSSFDDTAVLILLALGQMAVLLTRCVDLSVAANVALSGMIVALLNQASPDVPIPYLIALAVGIGALLGALNGFLVWIVRMPSIVVTLGTMAIYRGLVFVLSGGVWVTSNQMSVEFQQAVRAQWMGLSSLSWFAIFGLLAVAVVLRFTRLGRSWYLAGSNPSAASYVGVGVGRAQCTAFVLSGALAGLCGYLWVARFAVAYTDVASGFELQVIAACVIGGVSIAGGVGTAMGVLLGCLFLGIIKNALPLIGISPFWQTAVSGLVIIIAVVLNARSLGVVKRQILEPRPQ